MSCYVEGEALFKVGKLAEELQKGVVDVPGWTDFIKRKTAELKEAAEAAMPYLYSSEQDRVKSALTADMSVDRERKAATEEIIRTIQLPMTVAAFKCINERRQ
jgi:hypothetical protein